MAFKNLKKFLKEPVLIIPDLSNLMHANGPQELSYDNSIIMEI